MNWYIGQKAVCVHQDGWICCDTGKAIDGPKFKEELTVSRLVHESDGLYLSFHEYSQEDWYDYIGFQPLQKKYSEEEIENVNIDELTKEKENV